MFLINLPVGIVATIGCLAYLAKSTLRRRFDFFGFAMLSSGIGALQMMLDRGSQLDWFASPQIGLYAALVVSGFWIFVLHITSAEMPFLAPGMFADRSFRIVWFLSSASGSSCWRHWRCCPRCCRAALANRRS